MLSQSWIVDHLITKQSSTSPKSHYRSLLVVHPHVVGLHRWIPSTNTKLGHLRPVFRALRSTHSTVKIYRSTRTLPTSAGEYLLRLEVTLPSLHPTTGNESVFKQDAFRVVCRAYSTTHAEEVVKALVRWKHAAMLPGHLPITQRPSFYWCPPFRERSTTRGTVSLVRFGLRCTHSDFVLLERTSHDAQHADFFVQQTVGTWKYDQVLNVFVEGKRGVTLLLSSSSSSATAPSVGSPSANSIKSTPPLSFPLSFADHYQRDEVIDVLYCRRSYQNQWELQIQQEEEAIQQHQTELKIDRLRKEQKNQLDRRQRQRMNEGRGTEEIESLQDNRFHWHGGATTESSQKNAIATPALLQIPIVNTTSSETMNETQVAQERRREMERLQTSINTHMRQLYIGTAAQPKTRNTQSTTNQNQNEEINEKNTKDYKKEEQENEDVIVDVDDKAKKRNSVRKSSLMSHTQPIARSSEKSHSRKKRHSHNRKSHGLLGKKTFSQRQMNVVNNKKNSVSSRDTSIQEIQETHEDEEEEEDNENNEENENNVDNEDNENNEENEDYEENENNEDNEYNGDTRDNGSDNESGSEDVREEKDEKNEYDIDAKVESNKMKGTDQKNAMQKSKTKNENIIHQNRRRQQLDTVRAMLSKSDLYHHTQYFIDVLGVASITDFQLVELKDLNCLKPLERKRFAQMVHTSEQVQKSKQVQQSLNEERLKKIQMKKKLTEIFYNRDMSHVPKVVDKNSNAANTEIETEGENKTNIETVNVVDTIEKQKLPNKIEVKNEPKTSDDSELIVVWIQTVDPSTTRTFWTHPLTKVSTWERPTNLIWLTQMDPSTKRWFYVNTITRQSTWNDPRQKKSTEQLNKQITPETKKKTIPSATTATTETTATTTAKTTAKTAVSAAIPTLSTFTTPSTSSPSTENKTSPTNTTTNTSPSTTPTSILFPSTPICNKSVSILASSNGPDGSRKGWLYVVANNSTNNQNKRTKKKNRNMSLYNSKWEKRWVSLERHQGSTNYQLTFFADVIAGNVPVQLIQAATLQSYQWTISVLENDQDLSKNTTTEKKNVMNNSIGAASPKKSVKNRLLNMSRGRFRSKNTMATKDSLSLSSSSSSLLSSSSQSLKVKDQKNWKWTLTNVDHVDGQETGESFLFAASSEQERTKWLRAISNAVHDASSKRKGNGNGKNDILQVHSKEDGETTKRKIEEKNDSATNAFDVHIQSVSNSSAGLIKKKQTMVGVSQALKRPMIPRGKRRNPGRK